MPTPYALSSDLVSAWPAKSLEVATYLDTALAAKSDTAPAINAQTGTTYTFVLADATAGKTVTASNASASTYTVPPQSSVTFVAGALLRVTNLGAGVVTFAGGSGVTVTNTAGTLAQYQTATLVRTASDAWTVIPSGGASGLTLLATATATAASAISVNSCFTSTYANYLIILDQVASNSTQFNFRFRVSGSDNTTSNYNRQQLSVNGASVTGNRATSANTFELGYTNTSQGLAVIRVNDPAASKVSLVQSALTNNIASPELWEAAGGFNATTVFDGFTVYPGSPITFTGSLRVYGYKNT